MRSPFEGCRFTAKWTLTSQRSSRSGGKAGPPCRTLAELAEIFGVTTAALKAYIQHHPGAPQATSGTRVKHYPLPAMRKWWNEVVLPKIEKVSPDLR